MPNAPRLHSVQCVSPSGLHSMGYSEWGAADNPRVLICVHGLTRLGRDFDRLALALASEYRVVCPDVVGRGRSDYLRDPMHYGIAQYVADMVVLVARLDVEGVDWVGTSMGGLIGIGTCRPGAIASSQTCHQRCRSAARCGCGSRALVVTSVHRCRSTALIRRLITSRRWLHRLD